jgi:glycosyltransferase involved in cell wall biosynthesis
MLSAIVAGICVRKPDLVIATSPQFFCGWAGVWVSRLRRIPFILEVRDLWPESIVAVGAMRAGRRLRFLEWLEKRMYAAATRIVTVGEGYRDQLTDRGVAAERIDIVPNGVDRGRFSDRGGGPALRDKFDLGDAFVCSYIGTIGMGSGLEIVLRAARLLRDEGRDDIVFALIGEGAIREELEQMALLDGLTQVVFTGRQDKWAIPDFLSMTDACLVHLIRRDLFRTVLPSKIFEAAAMKKPIILGVEGSAEQIVREANAGICIEPENEEELVEAVKRLARDRDLADQLGQAGFDSIAVVHDYDRLAEKYAEVIERVAATENSRLRG